MPILTSKYHDLLIKKLLRYSEDRKTLYRGRFPEKEMVFFGSYQSRCWYFNKAKALKLAKFVFCSRQTSVSFSDFFGKLHVKFDEPGMFACISMNVAFKNQLPLVLESETRLHTFVEMHKRVFPYLAWLAGFCSNTNVHVVSKLALGYLKILSRRPGVEKTRLTGNTTPLVQIASELSQPIFFEEAKVFFHDLPAFLNTDKISAKKLTLMVKKISPLKELEIVNAVHKETVSLCFEYLDLHPLPDIPAFVARFKKIFPRCKQFTFSIQSKGIFHTQEDKAMEAVFKKLAATQEELKKHEKLKVQLKIIDEFPVSEMTYHKLLKNGFLLTSYDREVIVNKKQCVGRNLSVRFHIHVGDDSDSPNSSISADDNGNESGDDCEGSVSSDASTETFFYADDCSHDEAEVDSSSDDDDVGAFRGAVDSSDISSDTDEESDEDGNLAAGEPAAKKPRK